MEREVLLKAIGVYMEKHGYSNSAASNRLMGSGSWLDGVLKGGGFTISTYNKIRQKLESEGITFEVIK